MTEDSGAGAPVLDRLFAVIDEWHGADPATSYTAKLLAGGPSGVARKVGEEALETVIAACARDRAALTAESADLLYHLLVLWAASGLHPTDVWCELERREGVSGLAEKAARTEEE